MTTVSVSTREVRKALALIKPAIGYKYSPPVLRCVHVAIGEDVTVTFRATNFDISAEVSIPIKDAGAVASTTALADYDSINQVLKGLVSSNVTLSIDDDSRLAVRGVLIPTNGFDLSEFPEAVNVGEIKGKLPHVELSRALNFTGKDETQSGLVAVQVVLENNQLKLTATDSYRLYQTRLQNSSYVEDERKQYLVHRKLVAAAIKSKAKAYTLAVLAVSQHVNILQLWAEFAGITATWSMQEVTHIYPNIDPLIPKVPTTTKDIITFDKEVVLAAVKRVKPAAPADNKYATYLSFPEPETLRLRAATKGGLDITEDVRISSGEMNRDVMKVVNINYLESCLNVDTPRLWLRPDMEPLVTLGKRELSLLMPLRIKEYPDWMK